MPVIGRRWTRPGLSVLALFLVAACSAPATTFHASQPPSTAPGGGTGAAAPTNAARSSAGPATAGPDASPEASLPGAVAWAKVDGAGSAPGPREDDTWTVDPAAGIAYLFGGRGGGTDFGDLWAFDLESDTWTELRPGGPGPAARFGHDAAWVPGRGLVVTLGQAGSGFFDDIWLFDPATASWRELPGNGDRPVARYGSCSGIGPDGRLWISHGFTEEGSRFSDTRAYDFAADRWTDETPAGPVPVERCLHACWWTGDGDFVLYGGQTTGVAALGDLWALEGAGPGELGTWSKLADPGLAARQLTAVARRGEVTVLFGGRDVDRTPLGDTWLIADGDAGALPLEPAGKAPSARSGASLVHDAGRDRMLLFGGLAEDALGDLWQLTFE